MTSWMSIRTSGTLPATKPVMKPTDCEAVAAAALALSLNQLLLKCSQERSEAPSVSSLLGIKSCDIVQRQAVDTIALSWM